MKFERVDFVPVCVRDLDAAMARYSGLFDTEFYPLAPGAYLALGSERIALSAVGIALVEATRPASYLAAFIERAGEAALGLALKAHDRAAAVAGLAALDVPLLAQAETEQRREALLDPNAAHGVMLHVVEYSPAYGISTLEATNLWREERGLEPLTASWSDERVQAERLDHFLIYVADLERARGRFSDLLGTRFPVSKRSAVRPAAVATDGTGIELIQALTPDILPARFIASRTRPEFTGEGVAHISLKVANFEAADRLLRDAGFELIAERDLPTRRVALFGPGGGFGIGIELIAYRPLVHPMAALEMTGAVGAPV
jgi:hypothetical protein